MFEIKIYGEIIPFEEQGNYCSLSNVQSQLKEANGSEVKVRINSVGGDVDTGFAIYSELRRYAKDNKVKITTFGEARVASIATVIFLAGDERILTEHTEPFVHNAWTYEQGDSNQLMRAAVNLEKCNEKIAIHYASHTNLTKREALELMNSETSIDVNEALALRFATKIEKLSKPKALQNSNLKMNKMKNKNSVMAKILHILQGVKNKIVFDANLDEIDFYELEDSDVVEVGSKAKIKGQEAQGEIVIESGETYVFDKGVLTEIITVEVEAENAEGDDLVAENEKLKKEIEDLKKEIEDLKASSETVALENKKYAKAIEKIKNLKNEFELNEFKSVPTKTPEKTESRASQAVANLTNINLKK